MFRTQISRQSGNISRSLSRTAATTIVTAQRSRICPSLSTHVQLTSRLLARCPSVLSQRRWQSTDSDKKDAEPSTEGDTKSEEVTEMEQLKTDLEQSKKEVVDLKDKYLRSVADFRNLQDRTKRDMESARQFAIRKFASDLLDSVDNLDRALTAVPKESVEGDSANKDLVNLFSGLKMTNEILLNAMQKHGLARYDPLDRDSGPKFNPQTDEATFFTKVEGKEDGEVFFTQSKGFTLNGVVLRAAKVGVVKNS